MFDKTIQIYSTGRCDVGCSHCSSRLQTIPDMKLDLFEKLLYKLKQLGVIRIELFANNPPLHPNFDEQIELLNQCGLDYAILSVGDSMMNKKAKESFLRSIDHINRKRGGLVFSVDYAEKTAEWILKLKVKSLLSYGFKANTFWKLLPYLKENDFAIRTNTVITKSNIAEVGSIIERIAQNNIAVSFCFVQKRELKFKLLNQIYNLQHSERYKHNRDKLIREYEKYLDHSNLPNEKKNLILKKSKLILKNKEFHFFNKFRGDNEEEAQIDDAVFEVLRLRILSLKKTYPTYILPNEEFIRNLGSVGFGCINLLKQEIFPQLKIGTLGELIFCCDLHDPLLMKYSIFDLPEKQEEILDCIKYNPYIRLCTWSNPCDFSVNSVKYGTK